MQREIGYEVHIGSTVSLYGSIRKSSVIDRTASNYEDSREKVKKKSQECTMLILLSTTPGPRPRLLGNDRGHRYKRKNSPHFLQRHGTAGFSDNADGQLLCKPEQHPYLLPHENLKKH